MTEQQKLESMDRALEIVRRHVEERRAAQAQDRGWPVRYSKVGS